MLNLLKTWKFAFFLMEIGSTERQIDSLVYGIIVLKADEI